MLGRTDSRRRLLLMLTIFGIGSIALVARTAYWQVVRGDFLLAKAEAQTTVRVDEPSRRGDIYDRTGTVLLATTIDRERLVAAADQMALHPDRRDATADALIRLLKLDEADASALRDKLTSGKPYVILARGIEPSTADRIREAMRDKRVSYVALESEPERVYPQTGGGPDSSLAAHLLGFVNRENVGQYGVEQAYQDTLAGTPRVVVAGRDANGRPMPETAVTEQPGTIGEDLRLTIDASLQLALEQELLAAWIADEAKSASAVVMDPYTGAVYAEATYPSYDANDYRSVATDSPNRFIDPVVSNVYEPGSVFKMMTAVTALESGKVTRTTKIKDVGTLRLDHGTTKVDNADHRGMGWVTFEDGIAFSRNVVAAKVALKLAGSTSASAAKLYATWRTLGYGEKTGIDVAGEASGSAYVRDPGVTPWGEIDLANGSFGQGVAVTPIQLARAYAALVNGGTLIQPHVVGGIGDRDITPDPGTRVVPRKVSQTLLKMMDHVIDAVPFYRDRTLVPGYHVGGKTGTAQIWDAKKHDWKVNLFNYSFVGYIGRAVDVPDLVVAVRIEEGRPRMPRLGHLEMPVMSFELFRRIATDAINTPDLLTARATAAGVTDR
ncbi:MAG TPA: penicillin-binding protein 2 [Candidatus Limnocylindrales bacterium]|jgi:cell division protein FtsI/penicillin-binding protein 2|nr:penicillin-binding protein 2 [Candidatus Limnocylindrales bacterium]